jgi:hypothetical protein
MEERCKDINSYLSQFKEDMPEWLRDYEEGTTIGVKDIITGRVGYYPGNGFDGTLMKSCNKAHTVHSFLYVDYGISKQEMFSHLEQQNCIRGYHKVGRIEWEEGDLMPDGQYPLNVVMRSRYAAPNQFVNPKEKPYCFTDIMERDEDKDDSWGAKRFAVTFLFADGIATYYQLFCREYKMAPWIVLLQDHGFGGNYDSFGKGGLLDAIIKKNDIRPKYVLCATNTRIWDGYEAIKGLSGVCCGMHRHLRTLYKCNLESQLNEYKIW